MHEIGKDKSFSDNNHNYFILVNKRRHSIRGNGFRGEKHTDSLHADDRGIDRFIRFEDSFDQHNGVMEISSRILFNGNICMGDSAIICCINPSHSYCIEFWIPLRFCDSFFRGNNFQVSSAKTARIWRYNFKHTFWGISCKRYNYDEHNRLWANPDNNSISRNVLPDVFRISMGKNERLHRDIGINGISLCLQPLYLWNIGNVDWSWLN